MKVELERIKSDILTLAEIGRNAADRGIYRMAFTDADIEGKRWLTNRIETAGLAASMDGAANVTATHAGTTNAPRVLVGSHIDTVPCAGALDGTLGVVVGLECLRRLHEEAISLKRTIELIAFSDEEGRFGGMFGSHSVCGLINPELLATMSDLDGVKLADEMSRHGYDPLAALDAARDPESIASYLELHIEQGPVLDHLKKPIGIVDEITGLFTWSVWFRGEANHAGTTPMEMRKDAFMGLADFAHEVPRILDENGSPRSRATIGKAQILPGAANTVPGLVEFSLDVRDTSEEVLAELSASFQKGTLCDRAPTRADVRIPTEELFEACSVWRQHRRRTHPPKRTTRARRPPHAQRRRSRCADHGTHGARRHDFCPQQRRPKPFTC